MMLKQEEKFQVQDKCSKCGSILKPEDYFYRRASCVMGYRCSNCNFYECCFKEEL